MTLLGIGHAGNKQTATAFRGVSWADTIRVRRARPADSRVGRVSTDFRQM
jgi:hypothetical protein